MRQFDTDMRPRWEELKVILSRNWDSTITLVGITMDTAIDLLGALTCSISACLEFDII
jgi:hypothetical protein